MNHALVRTDQASGGLVPGLVAAGRTVVVEPVHLRLPAELPESTVTGPPGTAAAMVERTMGTTVPCQLR